jgi:Mg2+/citrate symporter
MARALLMMLVLGRVQMQAIVLVVAVMVDEAAMAVTPWEGPLTARPINLLG